MRAGSNVTDVALPWGAWHGDGHHLLTLPAHWSVEYLAPALGRAITGDDVDAALDRPIASEPLTAMARRARSVCIVTDDLARPTAFGAVLQAVVRRLRAAGVPDAAVRIVVATGAHRPLDRRELELKIGTEALATFEIENHGAAGLARTDVRYGDTELFVNATYLAADLKILLGSPLPHAFAGTSGGAKLVIPGLASLEATVRSHKFVLMGLRRGGASTRNTFREHIEDLVRQLGVHFAISVVTNANRANVAIFAGDLVESHRAASECAATLYDTPVQGPYDCLILNAYPKDTDLIQSENAFVALKRAALPVTADGLVLLTTAASEGLGRHGLFEPGGAAYRPPARPRAVQGRELWVYAPMVPPADAHRLYPEECRVFQRRRHLEGALHERFGTAVRCGVLPAAPIQLIAPATATSP